MKENKVANIIKTYAIFNAICGAIIGIVVGINAYDLGFLMFLGVTIVVCIASFGIYAIGEVIQLLEDIKNNTANMPTIKYNTQKETIVDLRKPNDVDKTTTVEKEKKEDISTEEMNSPIGDDKQSLIIKREESAFFKSMYSMIFIDGASYGSIRENEIKTISLAKGNHTVSLQQFDNEQNKGKTKYNITIGDEPSSLRFIINQAAEPYLV